MTVKEFVDGFLAAANKRSYVDKQLTRKYVPVVEKKLVLTKMAESAITVDEFGLKHIDNVMSRINYHISFILLYLNVEITEADNTFDLYDKFQDNDIFNNIALCIGERETNELASVYAAITNYYSSINNNVMSNILSMLSAVGAKIDLEQIESLVKSLKDKAE